MVPDSGHRQDFRGVLPMSQVTTETAVQQEEVVAVVGPVAEQPDASPPAEQPAEAPRQEAAQPDAQPSPVPETSAPPTGEAKLSKAQEREAQKLVDKAVGPFVRGNRGLLESRVDAGRWCSE